MSYENPPGDGGRGPRLVVAEPAGRRSRTLIPTLVDPGRAAARVRHLHGLLHRPALVPVGRLPRVFTTTLMTRVGLLIVFGLLMGAIVGRNMWLAYRCARCSDEVTRSRRASSATARPSTRTRFALHRGARSVLGLLAGVERVGRVADLAASGATARTSARPTRSSASTSRSTPSPAVPRFVLGFVFATVVLAFVASLVAHYLYGGIRLQPPGDRVSRPRRRTSVLLGVFVLLKASATGSTGTALGLDRGLRHRLHLQGRQRGAAGQEHPRDHRAGLRGAVLRQRVPRRVHPPGHRASCCCSARRSSSARSTRRSCSNSR